MWAVLLSVSVLAVRGACLPVFVAFRLTHTDRSSSDVTLDDTLRNLDNSFEEAPRTTNLGNVAKGDPDTVLSEANTVENDATSGNITGNATAVAAVGNPGVHLAKKACSAAWAETNKQTALILAATTGTAGMEGLKGAIRAAATAIQTKAKQELVGGVDAGPATPSQNRTIGEVLSTRLLERLGESDKASNGSEQMRTLGHIAGKSMWEGVQNLCVKLDQVAARGEDAVKSAATEQLAAFVSRASTVLAAPAPPPALALARALALGEGGHGEEEAEDILNFDAYDMFKL